MKRVAPGEPDYFRWEPYLDGIRIAGNARPIITNVLALYGAIC